MDKIKDKEFNSAEMEKLISNIETLSRQDAILVTTSTEMKEKIQELYPNTQVRILNNPLFDEAEHSVYIIPAEPQPIKVVFEKSPLDIPIVYSFDLVD